MSYEKLFCLGYGLIAMPFRIEVARECDKFPPVYFMIRTRAQSSDRLISAMTPLSKFRRIRNGFAAKLRKNMKALDRQTLMVSLPRNSRTNVQPHLVVVKALLNFLRQSNICRRSQV